MRRQWILIGQPFLQTIRTIEDKNIPSWGGEVQMRTCGISWVVQGESDCNGFNIILTLSSPGEGGIMPAATLNLNDFLNI